MQAWLDLKPKKDSEQTNRQMYGGELPVVKENFYLVKFLHQAGTMTASGFGYSPLAFTEIKAWSELTKMDLLPFEATAIHELSIDYCSIANNNKSPCPITEGNDEIRQSVDMSIFNQAVAHINAAKAEQGNA